LFHDRGIQVIDRLYFVWVILSLILPVAFALIVSFILPLSKELLASVTLMQALNSALLTFKSSAFSVALGGLMWGGFVRIFALHHATWSVNSVCHLVGKRPFATADASRNNAFVAVFTAGEGWHNGHHAFPNSAKHGLLKGQWDLTWMCVRVLERLGLAWAVKLPTDAEIMGFKQRSEA
jgi:stearoyl-CoA desaturase (Delta-9 desaturase)